MTELFIDGQLAVLPEKFSCKKVSENPFFTKSGDYTLDITISLLNPVNAKIYKHINRLNSLSRFEKRTAILISDNYVVIKGTEIILNHTHETVDIQIAAGNSSLNYLIGNDLKLRDLNMGSAVINVNEIENNLSLPYPHNNWLLLPFYDPDLDFVGNRYTYVADGNGRLRLKYAYDGVTALFDEGYYSVRYGVVYGKGIQYEDYRPQPYYCFIIKKYWSRWVMKLLRIPLQSITFLNSRILCTRKKRWSLPRCFRTGLLRNFSRK